MKIKHALCVIALGVAMSVLPFSSKPQVTNNGNGIKKVASSYLKTDTTSSFRQYSIRRIEYEDAGSPNVKKYVATFNRLVDKLADTLLCLGAAGWGDVRFANELDKILKNDMKMTFYYNTGKLSEMLEPWMSMQKIYLKRNDASAYMYCVNVSDLVAAVCEAINHACNVPIPYVPTMTTQPGAQTNNQEKQERKQQETRKIGIVEVEGHRLNKVGSVYYDALYSKTYLNYTDVVKEFGKLYIDANTPKEVEFTKYMTVGCNNLGKAMEDRKLGKNKAADSLLGIVDDEFAKMSKATGRDYVTRYILEAQSAMQEGNLKLAESKIRLALTQDRYNKSALKVQKEILDAQSLGKN